MPFGQVGRVRCQLIGDDSRAHVVPVGQCQVLLGGDVAEHGRAQPADLCRSDGRRDVVVARCYVRHQRPQGVEGGSVAAADLPLHVLLYLVKGHVSRSLDEGLHILLPRPLHQFAQGIQLRKLGFIVGIGYGAGAKAVAQRDRHVVLGQDFANLVEVFVQETLPIVHLAPAAHDASAAADDATRAPLGQVDVLQSHSGVDGKVVHSLLALFDEGVPIDVPCERFHPSVHLLQGLIDGHCAYGYGAIAHYPFARLVDVLSGAQVHQCVASPPTAPHGLVHLLVYAAGGGRIADVRIDFHQEVPPDNHRFALGMVDVCGQHGAAFGNLLPHKFGGDVRADAHLVAVHVFADGHILHLGGDDSCPCIGHLGNLFPRQSAVGQGYMAEAQVVKRTVIQPHAAIFAADFRQLLHVAAPLYPLLAHAGQSLFQVDGGGRVAVRSAGVVYIYRCIGPLSALSPLDGHCRGQVDALHSHPDVGINHPLHIGLFAVRVGVFVVGIFCLVCHNLQLKKWFKFGFCNTLVISVL